jgi:hypothetical protein
MEKETVLADAIEEMAEIIFDEIYHWEGTEESPLELARRVV